MTPEIRFSGGLYHLTWPEINIHVEASRVHEHRDGRTTAEIRITKQNGTGTLYLNQTSLNLLSDIGRKKLANFMMERMEGPSWEEMIEQLCYHVILLHRQGEPITDIKSTDEIEEPKYLIEPIMPENQPSIIYGPGSAGKSMFALAVGLLALLPTDNNPLGLKVRQGVGMLYLDWETDKGEIAWRVKCLKKGMGIADVSIKYRRCAMPLADDLEQVQRFILENNIGLVIIDSLGPACGGDLTAAEPALRIFTAIRQLGISCLILAHESKGETADKGPYGSVYFLNMARSVWHAKKFQEEGKETFIMALKHIKVNSGMLQKPLGFKLTFGQGSVGIVRTDLRDVPEYMEGATIADRILGTLRQWAATSAELASELDVKQTVIQKTLSQLKGKNLIVPLPDSRWGLPGKRYD